MSFTSSESCFNLGVRDLEFEGLRVELESLGFGAKDVLGSRVYGAGMIFVDLSYEYKSGTAYTSSAECE